MKIVPLIGGVWLSFAVGIACKTTSSTSTEKALPNPLDANLKAEDWIKACEAEIKDPQAREELRQLAETENCAKAYPVVKDIYQKFAKAGRGR